MSGSRILTTAVICTCSRLWVFLVLFVALPLVAVLAVGPSTDAVPPSSAPAVSAVARHEYYLEGGVLRRAANAGGGWDHLGVHIRPRVHGHVF
jgi:hypothetical protein